jgi:F-type H+-transporting ATPase subunit gamma
MVSTRALVKRRKTVRNIRKITRTMELIATNRFQRALKRDLEAEAYTRKLSEIAADLRRSSGEATHPLLAMRPIVRRSLLLVITSNRGLCGGYNSAILREANLRMRQLQSANIPLELELAGKRAITYYRYQGITPRATYTNFEDRPRFEEVEVPANRYIDDFLNGVVDQVDVAYMQFQSLSRQVPVVETLLPMAQVSGKGQVQPEGPPLQYEFIPNAEEILSELVPASFKSQLYKCFLDAAVSEQIARRVAMKQATENASEMIKSLTRDYNRLRQANITREIAEIIGGAAALE